MKNIANNKTVQRMEWIKTNTVVITYSDGKKETMSRKSFEQIIKGQVMGYFKELLFLSVGIIALCIFILWFAFLFVRYMG